MTNHRPTSCMTLEEYQTSIIDYLVAERLYLKEDEEVRRGLSLEEKIEKGYAIGYAHITKCEGRQYELATDENFTKWRPGDKVWVRRTGTAFACMAKVIDNTSGGISIECTAVLDSEGCYELESEGQILLDAIIELIADIKDGGAGAYYLRELAGLVPPVAEGLAAIDEHQVRWPPHLNESQLAACRRIVRRPSLYCVQGPPGTGKTDILSTIAELFSSRRKEVLIISSTHQAVNHALTKISSKAKDSTVVKIGELLKAQDLNPSVVKAETYNDYLAMRKQSKRQRHGDIVGMTLHAAIFNLGIRNSGFKPSIVLVDEAGQIPLTQAAAIGTFGCGSVIFIGDDRQMPPIYHEKLQSHPLSDSIFHHISQLYPAFHERLNVTYRMNDEITRMVSRNFYEDDGIPWVASEVSHHRRLTLNVACGDPRIRALLADPASIQLCNVTKGKEHEDQNVEEAAFVVQLIEAALTGGMKPEDLAIVTPFRRQVRLIREKAQTLSAEIDLPLIDTVERMQGKDVDMIILSFCVSSPVYYEKAKSFLFDPHRLNVMISRAKKKVIILASDIVRQGMEALYSLSAIHPVQDSQPTKPL